MKIKWNSVTWYSKIAAVVLGIGIFALGIYIGSLYQQGRDAMENAEGLRIGSGGTIPRETKRVGPNAAFVQEGTIKNMATGTVEVDKWVLTYGQSGATSTKVLIFTTQSKCMRGGETPRLCNTALFTQGERVRVAGTPDADGSIVVERLEMAQ